MALRIITYQNFPMEFFCGQAQSTPRGESHEDSKEGIHNFLLFIRHAYNLNQHNRPIIQYLYASNSGTSRKAMTSNIPRSVTRSDGITVSAKNERYMKGSLMPPIIAVAAWSMSSRSMTSG